ncbi:MAG: hypothetical protein IKF17_05525 [Clostridia bacterium]|nr:hypothetical protein [Clostridia bacterium]
MKKIQLIVKILVIILIAAIAFVGIYVQKQNRMENIVKDYSLGMDLKGSRVVELKVSDETKEIIRDKDGKIVKESDKKEGEDYKTEEQPLNSDEVKTTENYKKSKSIIEKRLSKLNVDNYIVKLDESTGTIVLEIPENDGTDHVVSNVSETGKFEIVDSENVENILMDNNDIKGANVLYNTTTTGTAVYLNIEFNKQGKEKLKNISNDYKTIETDTDSENDNDTENKEEKTEQKKITMKIDDNEMITTSFDETMENGSIQLSMGQASQDKTKINDNVESSATIATLLDTGNLPVEYKIESNEYVSTDILTSSLIKFGIAVVALLLVALLTLIIKYKKLGLLAAVEFIGFIALYSLLLRYTNVTITLEGIAAILVIIVMNYIFNYRLLNTIKNQTGEDRKKAITDEFIEFSLKAIPVCILSIVFCFVSWQPISSFGMTMFWGLVLEALYNITVAKSFLKE